MSYQAIVTFDLKNPKNDDYDKVYAGLQKLGFSRDVQGVKGDQKTPHTFRLTTTAVGKFEGASASDVSLRLSPLCAKVLSDNKVKGEVCVFSGGESHYWAYNLV